MAQIRQLRRRIKSVENTRKITKTMEMVATSKLKRAQDRVVASRPYAKALAEVISGLHDPELAERFPMLRQAEVVKRAAVVGLTSNRGLCGAFNANLIKTTKARVAAFEGEGAEVELHLIGRKGIGHFKYLGRTLASQHEESGDQPTMEHATAFIDPLVGRFVSGELDAVEIVYARFVSPLRTPPTTVRVLPVELGGVSGGDVKASSAGDEPEQNIVANYILRPSAEAIVEAILPLYVRNQMFRALVETAASEHGARRTAMKSATDNAGDMLDVLRRTYNRARQAQITQEIAEIVGGAEALKG
jgi:F-type H+-transporting ATPase subunit gamma